jgi:murein DD-endopeptidase MepM/ murein hydrolase activator NlpD
MLTPYGSQRHPQFGTVVFRRGIDISANTGDEVRVVDAGHAVWADWYKGYGRLAIIDHGSGLYTLYGHLSQLNVAKGDKVVRGQVIGLAGDTGSLKGSKLYFEVRRNGEAEDPLAWLAPRQSALR